MSAKRLALLVCIVLVSLLGQCRFKLSVRSEIVFLPVDKLDQSPVIMDVPLDDADIVAQSGENSRQRRTGVICMQCAVLTVARR